MSGVTAVRGLISGIAGARAVTTSPGADGFAPASIHLRMISISPSASFLPLKGMAGVTAPLAERPKKTSAPASASASVRALVFTA